MKRRYWISGLLIMFVLAIGTVVLNVHCMVLNHQLSSQQKTIMQLKRQHRELTLQLWKAQQSDNDSS